MFYNWQLYFAFRKIWRHWYDVILQSWRGGWQTHAASGALLTACLPLSHCKQSWHWCVQISNLCTQQSSNFVVGMYNIIYPLSKVDEARRYFFTSTTHQLSLIPQTQASLGRYVKRATFQAWYVWGQCPLTTPEYPSSTEWGWMNNS